MAALESEAARGKLFELGGPKIYSFRQLMELVVKEIERPKTRLVSLPFGLASLIAGFAEFIPNPPLTRDQVKMLRHDNIVAEGALGFRDLGIEPAAPDLILPAYLNVYRPGGWFTMRRVA